MMRIINAVPMHGVSPETLNGVYGGTKASLHH